VEKTRPDRAVGLNNCGDPRRVAAWRDRLRKPELHTEVVGYPAQFFRVFGNKPASFPIVIYIFEFALKSYYFLKRKSNLSLAIRLPGLKPVECHGSKVSRQK
jgi:hypothetical protein